MKRIKVNYSDELKRAKAAKKERSKSVRQEIKRLEKELPAAEYELKLLSNRGRLELILDDPDQIAALKDHWISSKVSKRLDYPIFMAVSERGGKNNSGDYEYRLDEHGGLLEFPDDHPQGGQLVIDQDLVNYDLIPADLADVSAVPDDQLCIAEAFIRFAQEQEFSFWRAR